MSGLSTPLLIAIFAGSSLAIWVAGVQLSKTTDALDARLGLGDAVGGLVLLGIAGSLPELAITASAAIGGNLELAVGNLLGGIAIQTVVLVVLDAKVKGPHPLTYLAGSLLLVLEGALVILITVTAIMGMGLPGSASVFGISPVSLAMVGFWAGGLWVLNRARRGLRWEATAPKSRPGRPHRRMPHPEAGHPLANRTMLAVVLLFGLASLVTLVTGVTIEEASNELAGRAGLASAVFGGTLLAAATALPEVSSGWAAVALGDHQLAISDIFGGNAFQPALFVVADALAGHPALPGAGATDLWLAGLGALLTAVYAAGIVIRPSRRFFRLGPDSILVVVLYALGVVGLVAIAR